MMYKNEIINELGITELLLPKIINEALLANDRIKYFFSLLQMTIQHADDPIPKFSNLSYERHTSGVEDTIFDTVISQSIKIDNDHYQIASFKLILNQIFICMDEMIAPLRETKNLAKKDDNQTGIIVSEDKIDLYLYYFNRYESLKERFGEINKYDIISSNQIDIINSAQRENGDSFHLLVMDVHKELNKLQLNISQEYIDGASVYGLVKDDRILIKSFMKGLNDTAKLKFEHEGLGTTATRSNKKLIIQNDIGATDVHVLVVHINNMVVTLTYTDIHIPRLIFFQSLFEKYGVDWNKMTTNSKSKKSNSTLDSINEVYHLIIGSYNAKDQNDLEQYLSFLGSRIVFLIDWNKARKSLTHFLKKQDCIKILKWAADYNYGHRAFLKIGGEQSVYDIIEHTTNAPVRYGQQLDEMLGKERTIQFIKFMLRICSQYLLEGKSEYFIRDVLRVKLAGYFHTTEQEFLQIISDHASLLFEISTGIRDGIIRSRINDNDEFFKRNLYRVKRWETKGDDFVNKLHDITKRSIANISKPFEQIIQRADDSMGFLGESAFLFTLLQNKDDNHHQIVYDLFDRILDMNACIYREYLKSIENAKYVNRGSSQNEIEDFLQSIDKSITLEHAVDEENLSLIKGLVDGIKDFKHFYIFSEIVKNIKRAITSLMIAVLTLRDYTLGNLMTS